VSDAEAATILARTRARLAETLARTRARPAETLARRRVPLGFITALVVFWLAEPTRSSLVAGGTIAATGELVRIWAAGHLNKAREVTSSGPYRWSAHPLYVGSAIMGGGLALASNSVVVAVIVASYLAVTLTAAVRSEEAFLRRAFGDRYDRYRQGALREDASRAENRRFSVACVIANREHRAVAGFALAVLLLVWKATYNGVFWRTAGR
jgi:protein-S-isoprenylcysteine O-methyltransferase Ste14